MSLSLKSRLHNLRKEDLVLQNALAFYQTALQRKKGRIFFIAGQRLSGRTYMLDEIARQLYEQKYRPHFISGSFKTGEYKERKINFETKITAVAETLQAVAPLAEPAMKALSFTSGGALGAVTGFIGQLMSACIANHKLTGAPSTDWREEIERLISKLAGNAPLALLIDDADLAFGEQQWFWEMLEDLIPTIDRHPILFFVTIHGNPQPFPPDVDSAYMWMAIRRCLNRQSAGWHYLHPLKVEEVRDFIGDAAPGVASMLHGLAQGHPGRVVNYWQEWKANNRVRYSSADKRWEYGLADRPTKDYVKQALNHHLKLIFRHNRDGLADAKLFLSYATLMGDEFVADVVAEALELDADDLCRFFDEYLVFHATNNPDGILLPLSDASTHWRVQTQDGELCDLRRYTFIDSYMWLASADKKLALQEAESREAALQMIAALQFYFSYEIEQLGSETPGAMNTHDVRKILVTLTQLCRLLSDENAAQHFQTMIQYRVSRAILIAQAERLMAQEITKFDKWELPYAVRILLCAGTEMTIIIHPRTAETLKLALQCALKIRDKQSEAECLEALAQYFYYQEDFVQALVHLEAAKKIWWELGAKEGEAECLSGLMRVTWTQGNFRQARQYCESAKKIYKEIGDQQGEVECLFTSAKLDLKRGDIDQAAEYFKIAKKKFEDMGDKSGEADCLSGIAEIEWKRENFKLSRQYFIAALKIFEEIENNLGKAQSLQSLAYLAFEQSDFELAQKDFEDAKKLYEKIGNQSKESECLLYLAVLALKQEDFKQAKQKCEAAKKIDEAIESGNVVLCLVVLSGIEMAQGNQEQARQYYSEAENMWEEYAAYYKNLSENPAEATHRSQKAQYFYVQAKELFEQMNLPEAKF